MKFIEIGNKSYEVKYTINVLCRMENDGIDVMNINKLVENVNFNLIRKLFFYGILASAGKSLTENKAGDMLDEYLENNDYNELMMTLVYELARSLGFDVDKKDEASGEEAGK